jgi:pimeloyl-ACP methyl ester carboxylesterase
VKSIEVGRSEMCYIERGEGIPLLLVHGFPLDHSMWTAQIDRFCTRCRVIAPDLPGFGRSPAIGDKVGMAQFADELTELLDVLEIAEPVVFCGLSMGGYIAFQFWRRHRSRLRGLVLCDSRATADSPEAAQARLAAADRVLREGPAALAESMLPKLFCEATRQQRPELAEAMQSVILACNRRGVAAAARGMAERPEMTGELPQIDCPTLVIAGENDVISPPDEMRRLAQAMPRASFVDVRGAGHMAPLENPAEVNAAMGAFLATLADA